MGRATFKGPLTDKSSRGKVKRLGGNEMRRLTLTTLFGAGLILITAAVASAEGEGYEPGEVLAKCVVVLEVDYGSGVPQTGDEQLDAVILELGVYEIPEIYDLLPEEPIDDPNGKWDWDDWQNMMDEEQLDTFYTFKYSSDTDPIVAAEMLAACDIVELAEPNYRLKLEGGDLNTSSDFIPNELQFNLQWHLHNTGQRGGTPDADIDAPEGWEYWFPNYPFRTSFVGVVDSGVGLYHPDLVGNLGPGYNVYEEGEPPHDIHGHGTKIAGIISAVTNNGIGVAGIGFNAIKVMPIKISNWDEGEKFNERVASKGIMWGAQNGADVLNFSWTTADDYGQNWYPAILHRWIRAAYKLGVVMCASAGNDGEWTGEGNAHYPSTFKEVITVTATDWDDVFVYEPKWWWTSNYGPDTEFCAPGLYIYTTYINGVYNDAHGTSMAAPHVAAACAIIQAHYRTAVDPPADRVAIARSILTDTVDDLGTIEWDQYYGWGRINLEKLMDRLVPDSVNGRFGRYAASIPNEVKVKDSQIEGLASLPAVFRLYQNYPNPAAVSTTFKFDLPASARSNPVSLKVYDLTGRRVATVVDENLAPGCYEKRWDCTNQYGYKVPPGVYVYRLIAGPNKSTGKLVVKNK